MFLMPGIDSSQVNRGGACFKLGPRYFRFRVQDSGSRVPGTGSEPGFEKFITDHPHVTYIFTGPLL